MLVQDREELVPFIRYVKKVFFAKLLESYGVLYAARKEILDQTDRIERYLAGLFLTPEGSKCNSSKPSKKCSGMKEEASETPFERIQREASKVLHKMWDFDFMFSAEQERVTGTSNESCDDELDEDLMELI